MQEPEETFVTFCPHNVPPYMLCFKCVEHKATMKREQLLYDTLERLSAAVDRFAAALESDAGS